MGGLRCPNWLLCSLPGFSHLPSGLYPSYLHLNHLEPPSSGSPLLSQLGQPSIFDTQKGQRAGVGSLEGAVQNEVEGITISAVSPETPAQGAFLRPSPKPPPPIAFPSLLVLQSSPEPVAPLGSS